MRSSQRPSWVAERHWFVTTSVLFILLFLDKVLLAAPLIQKNEGRISSIKNVSGPKDALNISLLYQSSDTGVDQKYTIASKPTINASSGNIAVLQNYSKPTIRSEVFGSQHEFKDPTKISGVTNVSVGTDNSSKPSVISHTPAPGGNETDSIDIYDDLPSRSFNSGAVWRGFIVFMGCSALVLLYLAIKTACSRRRDRQRRYTKVERGDELDVLAFADEDEEIFSANGHR
ncbi:uncharacterized protein LOC108669980 [Hyalella azteca]|uniref:Uncharacterized protein LOC108669980 n=1 Tax=Hyalella azteca TaxID=294128 RepID=A0A8B7NH06_HYAAZ|nr:uncharacterized protein LOC108669980 [Hyalella azteca]